MVKTQVSEVVSLQQLLIWIRSHSPKPQVHVCQTTDSHSARMMQTCRRPAAYCLPKNGSFAKAPVAILDSFAYTTETSSFIHRYEEFRYYDRLLTKPLSQNPDKDIGGP